MLFSQYKKLLKQIGELQRPICTLEKSQRLELLELSSRQEYYEKDIEDSFRLVIGELRQCLEGFNNWLEETSTAVDLTFGPGGTPKKIVALEDTFNKACLIKEQILSLAGSELEVAAAAAVAEELPLQLLPAPENSNYSNQRIRFEENDLLLPVEKIKIKDKGLKKNKKKLDKNTDKKTGRKFTLVKKALKPHWLKDETIMRIKEKVQSGFPAEQTVRQFIRLPFTDEEKIKLEILLGEIYK